MTAAPLDGGPSRRRPLSTALDGVSDSSRLRIARGQDTFKDVLETAAFAPAAPSYRHAQGHCMGRHVERSVARYAPPLPDGRAEGGCDVPFI